MNTIGTRLKHIRIQKGLSQSETARRLGVADKTVKNYENGFRSPTLEYVRQAAKEFDADLLWIIGEGNEEESQYDRYVNLFSAFIKARESYIVFEKRNVGWSNASKEERKAIREGGKALNEQGGVGSMSAALRCFFPEEPGRTLRAGDELNHLWNGIGNWRT